MAKASELIFGSIISTFPARFNTFAALVTLIPLQFKTPIYYCTKIRKIVLQSSSTPFKNRNNDSIIAAHPPAWIDRYICCHIEQVGVSTVYATVILTRIA
ncbi:unnamed protein product [Ilex paraguariensis]|uniref:Uncharacterized protein n=1 Tax=Ilex paraguariensis TaxID=185542 RepID=A0ABC8SPZ5_9AQUA